MQAARGVDDHNVAAVAARALDRVVGDGRGISAALAFDEVGAGALGPDAELFFRGGAEGVGRGDDDGVPVLAQAVRELADRRRLPSSIHADDEQDGRLAGEVEAGRLAEELRDLVAERLVEVGQLAARLEPADELGRRRDADVARDQRLLEPLPVGGVARIERRRGELGGERLPRARQGLP